MIGNGRSAKLATVLVSSTVVVDAPPKGNVLIQDYTHLIVNELKILSLFAGS